MEKRFDEILFNRFFEDWSVLSVDKVKSLLRVKAKTILPGLGGVDLSVKQRVKCGFDPTGVDLHIGHLCPSMVLNIFAKTGHHVDWVIGDFTARIGDPSGRVSERAVITDEQIAKNYETYVSQVSRFVDTSKFTFRKNSEWLSKYSMADFFALGQQVNLATLMQRDDFRKRMEAGSVTYAEVGYALLMGLDSVALNTTIELGGVDQLLNLQQCREVQRIYGQKPETIIVNPILEGLSGDGRKMSKSFNNYVALIAEPEDKFGKLMSLPDNLIVQYFKCFAYLYEEELEELESFVRGQPMEAKKQLATYFVAIEGKSLDVGLAERAKFESKFSKKELSEDDFEVINIQVGNTVDGGAPTFYKEELLLDVLMRSGKFKSRGELKRLLFGGAIRDLSVDQNGVVIKEDLVVDKNMRIKVGKLNFFAINILLGNL